MTQYIATPFVAATPEAIILGKAVQAFAENLESDVVRPLLLKYGLDTIDPEKWYPCQALLNVLRDVSEMPGGSNALVAVGKKTVETAVMPPEVDSIPKMLNSLNTGYHLNLRNVPAEDVHPVEVVSERVYRVTSNTPFPLNYTYGLVWGFAQRFRSPGEPFTVRIIESEYPGGVFEVEWGNK